MHAWSQWIIITTWRCAEFEKIHSKKIPNATISLNWILSYEWKIYIDLSLNNIHLKKFKMNASNEKCLCCTDIFDLVGNLLAEWVADLDYYFDCSNKRIFN